MELSELVYIQQLEEHLAHGKYATQKPKAVLIQFWAAASVSDVTQQFTYAKATSLQPVMGN